MSVSQILSGSPAFMAVNAYSGTAVLAAGGPGATITLATPFPVSTRTQCVVTPNAAMAGAVWVTFTPGAAGIGAVNINSNNAADAGKTLSALIWLAGAEGF